MRNATENPRYRARYAHPFVVQHAERTQFLIDGRLEVAEPSHDAIARLCQGNGILWLALVLKGEVEDGRVFGREGHVCLPALQREVPLAPLARLLGDGHDAAVGEREERGHGVLKGNCTVGRERAGDAGPQRVGWGLDGSRRAAGAVGAVVSLAEREHEHQADREHDARGRYPSRRDGARRYLTLLPGRRGGDDRAFVELELRPQPPVSAHAAGEDLHALAAGLEHDFSHTLRGDGWPDPWRRRQLEYNLALIDAVVVFGRERHPIEDVMPGLTLHDASHDVGEHECVGGVGARGEPPLDAQLRPLPDFDLS